MYCEGDVYYGILSGVSVYCEGDVYYGILSGVNVYCEGDVYYGILSGIACTVRVMCTMGYSQG